MDLKSLSQLPDFQTSRIAIKVKKSIERYIRQEHPWIFEDSITKQSKKGRSGDLVIVYDQKANKLMAIGLYDPFSPIKVKLIQFKKAATINEQWFEEKIQEAYQRRLPLLRTQTNSYRLIHGENDHFPGLVADVYSDVLVVKLYSCIWLPYFKKLLPVLIRQSKVKCAVLRLSRNLQQQHDSLYGLKDGIVIYGQLKNETVTFLEHGLRFSANVIKGHKTGYFLDHRHNRKKIGALSQGKTVLDIFAYAGGFSVHALAGGARSVSSVDISAKALKMARDNVQLNFGADDRHQTITEDAFTAMERLFLQNKRFDLVIVDPPSFAKRDTERSGALQSYARLARLAIQLVEQNGILLMASCSSRVSADDFFEVVLENLNASGRPFEEMERCYHDIDHPIRFPEAMYLKAAYFRILK